MIYDLEILKLIFGNLTRQQSLSLMTTTSTLEEILQQTWCLLISGANDKKDPLHLATIATSYQQIAEIRTVVLRNTDTIKRQLYFYTDIRSEKIQQLHQQPTLSWLFYHPKKNIQIRAYGATTIHYENDLTLEKWQTLPSYSRKTYGTQQAPSTPLPYASDDLPNLWKASEIDLADTEYAYANFAVVTCEINRLEWLHLQRSGHRRATFEFVREEWKGRWVVP